MSNQYTPRLISLGYSLATLRYISNEAKHALRFHAKDEDTALRASLESIIKHCEEAFKHDIEQGGDPSYYA